MKKLVLLLALALILVGSSALAASQTITFGWEQDMTVPVVGWKVYQSETSGTYGAVPFQTLVWDGTTKPEYTAQTQIVVPTGSRKVFFWTVTAYNVEGESGRSNEVSTTHDFRLPLVPVTFRATVTTP